MYPLDEGRLATLAQQGRLYSGTDFAQWGTGIAGPVGTAFNQNVALFQMETQIGHGICPVYLRMQALAATAATSYHGAIVIDTGSRYASGGTVIGTSNRHGAHDSGALTGLPFAFGAVATTNATGNARPLSRFIFRTGAGSIGDEIFLSFGDGTRTAANTGVATTVVGNHIVHVAPVILPPTAVWSIVIHAWTPTGPGTGTFDLEFCYYKK